MEGWEVLPAQEAKPVPEPSLGCSSCLSRGPRICVDGVDGEAGLFRWFLTLYLAEKEILEGHAKQNEDERVCLPGAGLSAPHHLCLSGSVPVFPRRCF